MSMSVRSGGRPVLASCLAEISYAFNALVLSLGCAGSAFAPIVNIATAPKICLMLGISFYSVEEDPMDPKLCF
jgi:hypothetical protein